MKRLKTTHHCNELRASDAGQQAVLQGWVNRRRDHGGVIFIDLRDRNGKTQVVFKPEHNLAVLEQAESLRHEYVIQVSGVVKARPQGMINPNLDTGEIDVLGDELVILNPSETTPILVNEKEEVPESEDIRLKYRYLDLRRPRNQKLIRLKSEFIYCWRRALHDCGFDEIETPILMKSTPEGARDFLVPSRMNPGKFYALPQSPQTYKQMLMIAGFEKYYQIAKCFRDEDLRADRQPEFLQIDCEMSFVDCEDIYRQFEQIVSRVVKEVWKKDLPMPFKRMPYSEAMMKFGSDKPDLRYGLEISDVSEIVRESGFKVFQDTVASGGVVRGLSAPECFDFTRKTIDQLSAFVGNFGAKGLIWMRCKPEGLESPVAKYLKPDELDELKLRLKGENGDMLFLIAGPENISAIALGQLRRKIAEIKHLTQGKEHEFVWITDFPMFEYSETEQRYLSMHHPFTAPHDDQIELLEKNDLKNIIAKAYDLVLNGAEIGGGSIRIHQRDLQKKVFSCLGLSDKEVTRKFGYFVEAFQYGAPPHGGIAFGLDRFCATLENRESIRDFIPFPKTTSGAALMEDCPSEVDQEQLDELKLRLADSD
ncbi:aspartate--tRNA ligase [Fibrobacterota bacterium]